MTDPTPPVTSSNSAPARPRPVVLGLTGVSGSGKDAVAASLAPLGYFRVALADPIKSALDDLGGPTREMHKRIEAAGWSLRKAWQHLGSESRVVAGCPDVFIDLLLTKIAFLHRVLPAEQRVHKFVIPDISYSREADEIRRVVADEWSGVFKVGRVVRPEVRPLADRHATEEGRANLPADFEISNCSPNLEIFGFTARERVRFSMGDA